MQAVLEGYSNFLREKKLAMPKHQSHLVRWVREFLLFAREHTDHTFEQTLDLFLTALGQRAGVKPWQIQQASDAIRIYRYQYRGDSAKNEVRPKKLPTAGGTQGSISRSGSNLSGCCLSPGLPSPVLAIDRVHDKEGGRSGSPLDRESCLDPPGTRIASSYQANPSILEGGTQSAVEFMERQ